MKFIRVFERKKIFFEKATSVLLIISMVLTLIGGYPKTVSAATNVATGNWSIKTDDVNGDWSSTQLKMVNTPEAQVMVRTGDIDNFGIGWNSGFTPFTGTQTNMPQTPFLPSGEPWCTDKIMVTSGYQYKYNSSQQNVDNGTGSIDKFTELTKRENVGVDQFYLQYDQFVNNQTNEKISVNNAKIQIYLGDFQPKSASRNISDELWNGNNAYTFKINNTYIPEIATVINSLDQTGHKGQLITVDIPSKYLTSNSDVRQALEGGNVPIRIDDTHTGATGDAFAVDFIKLLINTKSTAVTTGTSINVTDSSNQVISPYNNTGGITSNNIFSTPVKLAADPKAKISYGFNGITFSKYNFVKASNLTTVPQFPVDSAMIDIPVPAPNTSDAYKDDIGKQKYLTTKHYEYAGNAGTGSARDVSFGTPSFEGVFEQEAVTDSTKNPVKYDLGSTNGSNFYVSQKNSNNTSYGSALTYPTSTTIPYNGKYYPKTKYASWKAMKMWGYFVPTQTGGYKLGCWSDDGAYGYIMKDGVQQVFVDNWALQAPTDRTKNTVMQLTAGKYYPIYMEWYEGRPTQAAFVPEYEFHANASSFTSTYAPVPIPENELYSSKTTTPGDIAGAYFGDVSGISFPAQDGIYYIATKFKSTEGTTQGLYGPFIIDNTKPTLNNLVVTSNNANGNKWADTGNTINIRFTASENLTGNPQILINGFATEATITKDSLNNYTATVNVASDGSINLNKDKLVDGIITVQVAHYTDLYGNEGLPVQDSTVTYDNTSPTVAITYSANPTSSGTEIITATYSEPIKAGEIPKISIDQQGSADITNQNMIVVGADRKIWTYNYTVYADNNNTYKDGLANVSLSTVHDAAGNVSVAATGSTFTINTMAPTVTVAFSSNPVSVGRETITATYSEPVKSGETPQISINQQGTTDITNQNMIIVGTDRKTWTYDYIVNADNNNTYKDGVATVGLSTVHNALGTSAVTPLANTFIIDTKAPDVAITYRTNPVKAGQEIITATYSEPVKVDEIPQISINQQGSIDITSQSMTLLGTDRTIWIYDYTVNTNNGNTYKDGVATVSLVAHDAAGNAAATPSGNTFTIDTIAPTLVVGSPSATITNKGPITYTVTYSGADRVTLSSSNVSLIKTGTANGIVTASGTGNTRTITITNIIGDGTIGISIAAETAVDNAGNTALAPSNSSTFIVRNTIPAPVITSPVSGVTNNNKPTIRGTGEVGATVTVYDGTTPIGTSASNGTWSLTLTALADGAHAITAKQTDVDGNVSGVSNVVNLTIETTIIIKHGMFINGSFNAINPEYSIIKGFSGSFGVEFKTSIKKSIIQMKIDNNFSISDLKVYKIIGDGQPIYVSNIEVTSKTGNFNITMPAIEGDTTHFILAYKGTVNADVGKTLTNTIKVGNSLESSCNIKVAKLPDLH